MNRVSELRAIKGLSLGSLASQLNISAEGLRRFELGRIPMHISLAFHLCSVLDVRLAEVFPDARRYLEPARPPDEIFALADDEKASADLVSAGLDPHPAGWYILFEMRNAASLTFPVSSYDADRLERNLSNARDGFFVFNSIDRQVIVNLSHIVFAHILFQEPTIDTDNVLQSVRVHLSTRSEPLLFEVEAEDPPDGSGPPEGQCQALAFYAGLENAGFYFRFMDADGERAFFRASDTAMIEMPEWVLDSRLLSEDDDANL
jgi:transcriptional regulator with XRE-family HTH domain